MARKVSYKVYSYAELTDAAKAAAIESLEQLGVTDFKPVLEAEFTADGKYFDPSVLAPAQAAA